MVDLVELERERGQIDVAAPVEQALHLAIGCTCRDLSDEAGSR